MRRAIPVLIVGTILALAAATGADRANRHVAQAANIRTTTHYSTRVVTGGKRETPRQKARRIITATWPSNQVDNAMKVVACESGFNQWATNTTDIHSDGSRGSFSWFQVGAIWRHDPEVKGNIRRLYLPWTNARVAYRIWKRQGWWAWRNCAMRAGLL